MVTASPFRKAHEPNHSTPGTPHCSNTAAAVFAVIWMGSDNEDALAHGKFPPRQRFDSQEVYIERSVKRKLK